MEQAAMDQVAVKPYFLENRVTTHCAQGDILYSNIHNVPIISHVKYDSTADHFNITAGSIICKIGESKDNVSSAECDALFPKGSESVTIHLRRLIPYRKHLLGQSTLILFWKQDVRVELSTSEEISGDFYLNELGQLIVVHKDDYRIYSIRDASISLHSKYIQCNLLGGGYILLHNIPNQRDFLHAAVYCFYRIFQFQQQTVTQSSASLNPFNSSLVLFKGDIEFFRKKQTIFPWKPRTVIVTDLGTILVKLHSKVKMILKLEELTISNDYSKILQEKNTSTKNRVLWIASKRAVHEKETKRERIMLFRFADEEALTQFFHCVHNIASEEQRINHQFICHSYSSLQRELPTDEDNEIFLVCKYARLLQSQNQSNSPNEKPSVIQKWNPVVEKKGRELYEISMRIPAIMKNPQILTRFLYTLHPTGITLQLWDQVICQFFPLFCDANQRDLVFQILSDIHNPKKEEESGEESNPRFFELLREKYIQLNSSQRHRRYSFRETSREIVTFEVFEEYIHYFQKKVERQEAKSHQLHGIFDKYRETIQFGNGLSTLGELIVGTSTVCETVTKTMGILFLTCRWVILVIVNEVLMIPINYLQSCTPVNRSLHLVFTRFTTLPETSRIRSLLKLPTAGDNTEKDMLLCLKFVNKFVKSEDYSSFLFFNTAVTEFMAFYQLNKVQLRSFFGSSSLTSERNNQMQYLILNLFRMHSLLLQTGTIPVLHSKEVVVPAVQSFTSLFTQNAEPASEFEKFDLILCKREIMLFFLLMNEIGNVFKALSSIATFDVPGVSIFIFIGLNYIALTNRMRWFVPFLLLICFVGWYYSYFHGRGTENVTLQEALETRQLEKRTLAGKGLKNKLNSYMLSVNKFYTVVMRINKGLLKVRSLLTWTDVNKTYTAMIILIIVVSFFYFLPSNVVVLIVTNFIFTKRWRDPDPPIRQYLRHYWNSIPLPAFSREHAALEELYTE